MVAVAIHGLTVVADSFIAIDDLVKKRPEDAGKLLDALKKNFEVMRNYINFINITKICNAIDRVDIEAAKLATNVAI